MRRMLLLVVLVVACAGAVHVGTAQATSSCGTITSNTTLTADCAAPLTVGASGITIDLGDHSVLCNSTVDGIDIPLGVSSSTVSNGSVQGGTGTCFIGVAVDGDANQLTSLTVSDASFDGVVVSGDSNNLLGVTSEGSGHDGLFVFGSFNIVRLGTFAANGFAGASFLRGASNGVTRSRSILNDAFGFRIGAEASKTSVTLNTSSDNGLAGFVLRGDSTGSVLFLNKASFNPVGVWIDSTSNHNSVLVNGSYLNGLDMEDDNASCDTNLWFANVFVTSNQGCIG